MSLLSTKDNGFTLIELMIVVVIIGLLASQAIPRFMPASVKTKQSEAKQLLRQIYTMERAYRQEHDTYLPAADNAAPEWADLGVDIPEGARYSFSVTAGSGDISTTFWADAIIVDPGLDDDVHIDHWRVNEMGNLVCLENDAGDITTAWAEVP